MIIIYISHVRGGHQTTSNNQLWRRYRINDLHQLNVKQLQTIAKSATLNTGQSHVNEEQNPQQQPATSAFIQMIEQINIALEQKGPGISQLKSLKLAVGD